MDVQDHTKQAFVDAWNFGALALNALARGVCLMLWCGLELVQRALMWVHEQLLGRSIPTRATRMPSAARVQRTIRFRQIGVRLR